MRDTTHIADFEHPIASAGVCSVSGCDAEPLMAVVSDGDRLNVMCLRHALAWTESTTCRDFAQYDESGYFGHLADWVADRG